MNDLVTTAMKEPVSAESVEHIYDFLQSQKTGVLSTVGKHDRPYGAVVYFSIDKEFNVYFTTKRDTRKSENIQHNKHVSFVTFEPVSQTTAQIVGTAEEISDPTEAQDIFRAMLKTAFTTSLSGLPPISKLYAGYYISYRIKPEHINMAVFARPDPGGYDIFESIDFKN